MFMRTFLTIAFCFLASYAHSDVSLPAVFSDHMVLQSNTKVPIWGWADPGERVSVALDSQIKYALSDASGKWSVTLDEIPAGLTVTIKITGKNTVIISDVLTGEVWLALGQSNMGVRVEEVFGVESEVATADLPQIRIFEEISSPHKELQSEPHGFWKVSHSSIVRQFPAVPFFFARTIHEKLKAPVGMIVSFVGGTPVEAWTRKEVLDDLPDAKAIVWKYTQQVQHAWDKHKTMRPLTHPPQDPMNVYPGHLFNSKINPLIPYAIRGMLWYQGEANAETFDRSKVYEAQLQALIYDLRQLWRREDLPFLMTQLANYREKQTVPVEEFQGWPMVRESVLKLLRLPNTGMAVTIDVGEEGTVHPRNKQDVGKRLANWALAKFYNKGFVASGPLYRSHVIKDEVVLIEFDYVGQGLWVKGDHLTGFAIAGENQQWLNAQARIDGNTVIVSHPQVKDPVAVRYAWAMNPVCNLYNAEGLPASPFRTDNWDR